MGTSYMTSLVGMESVESVVVGLVAFLVCVSVLLDMRLESEYSVLCFLTIFVGYLVQSSLMYVVLRVWPCLKTQPRTQIASWVPVAGAATVITATAPHHYLFSGVNLIVASTCSLLSCEAAVRGWSNVDLNMHPVTDTFLTPASGVGIAGAAAVAAVAVVGVQFLFAFALQSVLEYWWHRLMHLPVVYVVLHKHHHYYKSPEPFCDLYIHPMESLGYQVILWAPPFAHRLLSCLSPCPMRLPAFMLYMAVMGVCGVLDHSGISLTLGGTWGYSSCDHDLHHERYNWNYAFPLPLLDKLHGTYMDPHTRHGRCTKAV